MSTQRHTIHIHFGYGDDPEPRGVLPTPTLASLDLGDSISLLGGVTASSAIWLRKLATEADKLADAIEARRAEKETARHDRAVEPADQPLAGSDQPTRPPYPPGDIGLTARLRLAEAAGSTAGETRDVPTPGAAT